MGDLRVEVCSETGICSIVKADGTKVDLLANEVAELRAAKGDAAGIKKVIGECDSTFAGGLNAAEVEVIADKIG